MAARLTRKTVAPLAGEGQGGDSARALDGAVDAAAAALIGLQKRDGEWAFALEADATIPAES
ncbi:MAG TPA: hypothetical protein VNF99_14195, partial [Stellaceae bacterium]|nr:hypothetical protein [Stellaceae bacterium]